MSDDEVNASMKWSAWECEEMPITAAQYIAALRAERDTLVSGAAEFISTIADLRAELAVQVEEVKKWRALAEGATTLAAKMAPIPQPQAESAPTAQPVAWLRPDQLADLKRLPSLQMTATNEPTSLCSQPVYSAPTAQPAPTALLEWAVTRWREDVQNRPLVNIYRAGMDKAWRCVIRHAGGDPDALVGPSHGALVAAQPRAESAPTAQSVQAAPVSAEDARCSLGCATDCLADLHGCPSECPALHVRRWIARRKEALRAALAAKGAQP